MHIYLYYVPAFFIKNLFSLPSFSPSLPLKAHLDSLDFVGIAFPVNSFPHCAARAGRRRSVNTCWDDKMEEISAGHRH